MNRFFTIAVLTVTMCVMMSTAGFALVAPHDVGCDSCHGKFLGSGTTDPRNANNACITCHSVSGEASRTPMQSDSMANFFGTVKNLTDAGSRSTHTFNIGAGDTVNPAAKVQEPVSAYLNTGRNFVNLTNTMLCIRCHDAKSNNNDTTSGTPPNAFTNAQHFMRVSNQNDALCLDCHRSRQVTSSSAGSHPVTYRAYSTVYKSNTTAYRKTPLSGNIYNPSSNPKNYLVGNKLVCTTCHAPHYADSSSSTFDNRSTANGSAQDDPAKGLKSALQNSKGTLLRGDYVTAAADQINACSSCHKETANINHNGKGQNVQCNHCHSAHVDYTADGSAPNVLLVRRYFSNISIAAGKLGAGKEAVYNGSTSLRFMRADGKGICQVCHVPTPGVGAHDNMNAKKADCTSCHSHKNGFAASDCTSCHGQPPVTSVVGGPNGKSSATYNVDEATSPHAVHATSGYYNFACANCHYNGTPAAYHNTKSSTGSATFQSVFIDTVGTVGDQAGHKNIAADYNPTTRVCSNVYCHSNGDPRNGTFTPVATPGWEYGKNKIIGTANECSSCHGYGATLTTNAHQKHITSGVKCAVCHSATVNGTGQITDRTRHANATKDVLFTTKPENYVGVFSASFNATNASCANSCHGDGNGGPSATTPVWTDAATGACGTCHAATPTTSLHPFHFTNPIGPQLGATPACSSCHDQTTGKHANGKIDMKPGNSCAPCHPALNPTPIWATSYEITCESCHVGTASVVTNPNGTFTAPLKSLASGHATYSTAITKRVGCTTCHDGTKPHIGAAPTEKRLKLAGNDLCNDCHTSSKTIISNPARVDLPVHGGSVNKFSKYTSAANVANIAIVRADACAGCHDTHGTTNNASVRTIINGLSVTYVGATPQFIDQVPDANGLYHGLCQVCHTKTRYFNRNTVPSNHATGECLTCHKHSGTFDGVTVKFAFQPVIGGCNGCHGYPPVKNMTGLGVAGNYSTAKIENYAGGGGAHSVAGHISKTAVASQAWTNCSNCHSSVGHPSGSTPVQTNVNVTVDAKFKFNSAQPITYSANNCSNVSCHFKPSPNWVTGN